MYLRVVSLSIRSSLVVLEDCILAIARKKLFKIVGWQIGSNAIMDIRINVYGEKGVHY